MSDLYPEEEPKRPPTPALAASWVPEAVRNKLADFVMLNSKEANAEIREMSFAHRSALSVLGIVDFDDSVSPPEFKVTNFGWEVAQLVFENYDDL